MKVLHYADDATNFIKNERYLSHLLRVVSMYDKGSGAKLIIAKSQAMWLGQWRANGASPFSLKLVNIKLKLILS